MNNSKFVLLLVFILLIVPIVKAVNVILDNQELQKK